MKSRVLKWVEESAAEWNRVSQYLADGIRLSKADWDWALDMVGILGRSGGKFELLGVVFSGPWSLALFLSVNQSNLLTTL